MRELRLKSQFKRDLKKAKKNPRQNVDKLNELVTLLVETGELPADYLPHPLSGNWSPTWECHIQPDFLLIYETTDNSVTLFRCGSHSALFN